MMLYRDALSECWIIKTLLPTSSKVYHHSLKLKVFHKIPKETQSLDTKATTGDIVKMALGSDSAVSIAQISNLSTRDALVSINESKSLDDVLSLFSSACQRVVVVAEIQGGSNKFVGVISQVGISY